MNAPLHVLIIARSEDDALRAAFGKSWDLWAAKIRYRLVPGVY